MPDSPASVGNGHFALSPLEIERETICQNLHAAWTRVWKSQTGVGEKATLGGPPSWWRRASSR